MAIDNKLLSILVCPVTKVSVKPLAKDQLATLNRLVESGEVRYRDGAVVDGPLEDGLITTDGKTVYRIDDGIPVMLEERGIAATQVPGW